MLTPGWNLELSVLRDEHDGLAGNDLTLTGAALSALRVFSPEARASPYLIVSGGMLRESPRIGGRDESPFVDYGLGFLADLANLGGGARKLQLRGELKGRRAFETSASKSDAVDYVAGIGLQYLWGGTPVPAAAPVVDSDGSRSAVRRLCSTTCGKNATEAGRQQNRRVALRIVE